MQPSKRDTRWLGYPASEWGAAGLALALFSLCGGCSYFVFTDSPDATSPVADVKPPIASSAFAEVKVPEYSMFKDESGGNVFRIKILVSGEITEAGLRSLVANLYLQAPKLSRPTHYSIFAYTDRDRAINGDQWIARLEKLIHDTQPTIDINDPELKSLASPPTTRFGLTEAQRRELYKSYGSEVDYKSFFDAIEVLDVKSGQEGLRKNLRLETELEQKYHKQFLRAHGLPENQWTAIEEASDEDWTYAPLPKDHARRLQEAFRE